MRVIFILLKCKRQRQRNSSSRPARVKQAISEYKNTAYAHTGTDGFTFSRTRFESCPDSPTGESERTVQRWLKQYQAEEIQGLYDVPQSGSPGKVEWQVQILFK